eukprot:6185941-Pleurochrysis_carterae.AAC.1
MADSARRVDGAVGGKGHARADGSHTQAHAHKPRAAHYLLRPLRHLGLVQSVLGEERYGAEEVQRPIPQVDRVGPAHVRAFL